MRRLNGGAAFGRVGVATAAADEGTSAWRNVVHGDAFKANAQSVLAQSDEQV